MADDGETLRYRAMNGKRAACDLSQCRRYRRPGAFADNGIYEDGYASWSDCLAATLDVALLVRTPLGAWVKVDTELSGSLLAWEITQAKAREWFERGGAESYTPGDFEVFDYLDDQPLWRTCLGVPRELLDDIEQRPDTILVELRGPLEPPVIMGSPAKRRLPERAYTVIKALIEAGDRGIPYDELVEVTKVGGARDIIKRLIRKDEGWDKVLETPGGPWGGPFRIKGGRVLDPSPKTR